ncbi:hypothetical protein GS501_02620 [Saccharibacter sp. 17.LH.SD]|uniref:hypothetical protein n=1 Tax=Saccharibacter sp. 17.LH.SD TaxID=2689393 RepID=UPI0013681DA3|nr:hypothetical protein [Saccharibacter sp. 17.LH.SD]MXV43947.1 hypothetical protein [Saccharibacter sp. 17.LH.SD]
MIFPTSQGVMRCPCCHKTISTTAAYCVHCKAEKRFGPLRRENILYSALGLILALVVSSLLIPLSFWNALFALGGLGVGFVFAQYRFSTDRWICSK